MLVIFRSYRPNENRPHIKVLLHGEHKWAPTVARVDGNSIPLDLKMPMKYPSDPGLSIQHDCLEPLGLNVSEAARKLNVNQEQLSDILNGYSGISDDMAVRLD